jgi:hypothetical protein
MKKNYVRLGRVRALASRFKGDPHSVFYGDATVTIDPEDAADAIRGDEAPQSAIENAIASDVASDAEAAERLAAYNSLSETERLRRTLLPPLAAWNAMVIVNPMLGKVLAKSLDYLLCKALTEFPFEGGVVSAAVVDDVATVTLDSNVPIFAKLVAKGQGLIAIPFFRFTIAASTLNAAPGSQVSIDIQATDAEGNVVNTQNSGYTYAFQRINNTEAVLGVYIPTQVIATRTLPFLPVVGKRVAGDATPWTTMTIVFRGVQASDKVYVTLPGYTTAELREVSAMYNLPSGMIR